MFGRGEIISPILILVGIWICALVSIFLGVGYFNEQVGVAGAILGVALFGFLPLFLFAGVGVYLLITGRREAEELEVIRKKERILGLVQAQGQVSVGEIMVELELTRKQITNHIFELVGQGLFTGYIDWDALTFYSKDASAMGDNQCPNCGGVRELVGKGVVKCPYCGVSLFIPPDAEQKKLLHPNLLLIGRKAKRQLNLIY